MANRFSFSRNKPEANISMTEDSLELEDATAEIDQEFDLENDLSIDDEEVIESSAEDETADDIDAEVDPDLDIDTEADADVDIDAEVETEVNPDVELEEATASEETLEEDMLEDSSTPADIDEQISELATSPEADAQERIAELEEQITGLRSNLNVLVANLPATRESANSSTAALSSLRDATNEAKRSLAWQIFRRMDQVLEQIAQDMETTKNIAQNIASTDADALETMRKKFLKRFWISFFVALTIMIVVYLVRSNVSETSNINVYLRQFFGQDIYVRIVIYWMLYIFGALVAYYRTWSTHARQITVATQSLTWAQAALAHSTKEQLRLSKLYAHTRQWIELFSESLYNPWTVDDAWESTSTPMLKNEDLPYCVRVAQAIEGSNSAITELERVAAKRLLRPGWRDQVFNRQIAAVARSIGLDTDRFNIETMERDSPSIPNGSRAAFSEYLKSDAVQKIVARSYLSELNVEVQTRGLLESKPPVQDDYQDELQAIQEDLALLGEEVEELSWDEFLLDIVGNANDPITPMSPLTFTSLAVTQNIHSNPEVLIQMPERLAGLAPQRHDNRVSLLTYLDSARLPLDLVVRTEFIGPIDEYPIRLWSMSNEPAVQQPQSLVESTFDQHPENVAVCRKCASPDCPASDPDSNIECKNT